MALTQAQSGMLNSDSQNYGFKNRIINGAMMIDQRNAGASFTPTQDSYMTDRWKYGQTQSSKFTAQQSTTAPAGFTNSLLMTVTAAVDISTTEYFTVYQPIEGYNVADLGWGTANAQTVTLSFWVRSSLTGTFGGSLRNSSGTRSYPFSYTISSANTWTQASVTITGDTSGTWVTNNGVGIYVQFGLGVRPSLSGTAGAWAGANYLSCTGATSVVGTNGSTFYITGIQLEKGTTATQFDYRPYGTELQLCQRYFQKVGGNSTSADGNYQQLCMLAWESSTTAWGLMPLKVTMRAQPTTAYSGSFTISYGTNGTYINDTNQTGASIGVIGFSNGSGGTAGQSSYVRLAGSNTYFISFSAEL
jgi:hypothetical protein